MTGYNYIVPKSLNPDYVYWEGVNGLGQDTSYTFSATSLNPESGILKYRFLHNVKADVELTLFKKLSIGVSAKYFSKMENMDRVIESFEEFTEDLYFVQNIEYMDYYNSTRHGNLIFDARIGYKLTPKHKIAIISSNVGNKVYSLRPLKIEPPRTIMLQYSFKLDKNT